MRWVQVQGLCVQLCCLLQVAAACLAVASSPQLRSLSQRVVALCSVSNYIVSGLDH